MSRFKFHPTSLAGLYVAHGSPQADARGFFGRLYCMEEFRQIGLVKPIVQINHSYTREKAAARGLHFQYPPHAETKIVMCLRGNVFDVAVDLRRGSSTFLQWHGEIISSENHRSMVIPEGYAHGFQTLSEDCELLYLHTAAYAPHSAGALNLVDPRISIAWPHPIGEISERDRAHPFVASDFAGIDL